MTIDELRDAALLLAPEARARLARDLLGSLETLSDHEIEELWLREAARRDAELENGSAKARPADEVLARARARRE